MEPLPGAALLGVLFVGTHVGLATRPIRTRLVARFGERGFRTIFFAVAALSFTLLTVYYADHRSAGGAGLALGTSPGIRLGLESVVVLGLTLMVASFATYPGSPYDLDQPGQARPPRGLERVTRHPFFAGFALFATAHALLATHLVATVLMLALAGLALVGARHQDAKLARLRGAAFGDYLAATSALPFAAIAAGRQRLVWRELPFGTIAFGLVLAWLLRRVHEGIFAHRGAWVVLVVVGSASVIMLASWLRDRRLQASQHPHAA
jgi:uncharacterized membrane protein